MNTKLSKKIIFAACIIFFVSAACDLSSLPGGVQLPGNPPTPTTAAPVVEEESDPIEMVAEKITEIPTQTSTATSTSTPSPTRTPLPRSTLLPSSTPIPSFTPFKIPKVYSAQSSCNAAKFVEDVTIPDGTNLPASYTFDKTWRIQNVGTCTWGPDYTLVFEKGDSMNGSSVSINATVKPKDIVTVTIRLRTPSSDGNHRGYWILQSDKGTKFGSHVYVDVNVGAVATAVPDPRIRYDFAENYCSGTWFGNEYLLTCPGVDGSSAGYVLQMQNAVLESGYIDNEKGLLVGPASMADGVIVGGFPAITVEYGDHFRSIVGCQRDAKSCNVRFGLLASVTANQAVILGSWDETYNESYTSIDVDLSNFAGQQVVFYLAVYANGDANGDRALWLRPRILKP